MSAYLVPFSCEKCRNEGSPTGQLVFERDAVPICRYHGIEMLRSAYYNEDGTRRPTKEVLEIGKRRGYGTD